MSERYGLISEERNTDDDGDKKITWTFIYYSLYAYMNIKWVNTEEVYITR